MPDNRAILILFCADTHLGFDDPVRLQVARRRRIADFDAGFFSRAKGRRDRGS